VTLHVGVTATRNGLTIPQQSEATLWAQCIRALHPRAEIWLHMGVCRGGDVWLADMFRAQAGAMIHGHPASNTKMHDRALYPCDLTDDPVPAVDRNDVIIARSLHGMRGYPATPYDVLRSGTWTTIRHARKAHRDITVIRPDGLPWDPPGEEGRQS